MPYDGGLICLRGSVVVRKRQEGRRVVEGVTSECCSDRFDMSLAKEGQRADEYMYCAKSALPVVTERRHLARL